MKKTFIIITLFHLCSMYTKNSIIVLYGCSSTGKTSIANQLCTILPGKWEYIASNRFQPPYRNNQLWKEINKIISLGSNVIVDTHNSQFLVDSKNNPQLFTILLYCSPINLIKHVSIRNKGDNQNNHRKIKTVFQEYCEKYKRVKKNEPHIATLHQKDLTGYSIAIAFALKKIRSIFFQNKQEIAYVAPIFSHYNCLIDTGKLSINECAQKIKKDFLNSFAP
ncbi:hypothetical protein HYV11_01325 [Candidatus Dependentiae bacterium]|nr:hypothetical protein [Candidatus Dependentiae bacterium]